MSKIRSFTILSLLIYLAMMCYTVVTYSKLPTKVPIHYNLAGYADNFADKWVLLLINSAFIVIWLIFSLQVDTMNDLPNGHIIIIHHVKFERLNYF